MFLAQNTIPSVPHPLQIGGLVLWINGNDFTTVDPLSGSLVTDWREKSGYQAKFTQSTTANKPTYTTNSLNGKSSVDFDGVNDYMTMISNAQTNVGDNFTFVVVFKYPTGGTAFPPVIEKKGFCYSIFLGDSGSTLSVGHEGVAVHRTVTITRDVPHVCVWAKNGASRLLEIDAVDVTEPYTNSTIGTSASAVTLGGDSGSRPGYMSLYEIMLYNRKLSTAEVSQLNTYCFDEWGI